VEEELAGVAAGAAVVFTTVARGVRVGAGVAVSDVGVAVACGVASTAGAAVISLAAVTSAVGVAVGVGVGIGVGSTVGVAAIEGRGVIESSETVCDPAVSGTIATLLSVQTAARVAPGAITAETGVSLAMDPRVWPGPPVTLQVPPVAGHWVVALLI
jgi:hypothetical protein